MALQIKASLLLVLLLIPLSSGVVTEGFKDGMNIINSLVKNGIAMNSRKLLRHDLSDYDYAGANPKHDPCKKGRSNCPRNP
ncbi:uncharacterized protein LOC117927111 [Vitis riparia]|uniref:uncharacterized protein LOC117927111 n=1 Tax=Vitis riparia TaxID=96939 RepID=UPI00155AAAC7|nr:uncharacterized protein LOC117927111 [Vitis riparia]